MDINVPNTLTLLRILLIPVFVLVFYLPYSWSKALSAVIFALAAITDWLDGYLARRLSQVSAFGTFLDPVADKLMVTMVLVLVVQINPTPWVAIPAAVIVGREITISALREWMAELGKRAHVAVSGIGKIKTIAQMLALVLLLYREPVGPFPTEGCGILLLLVAATLTLWSMVLYLRAAWPSTDGSTWQKAVQMNKRCVLLRT
jgi:CDP-diacylglycerol--glycerol-3-phosphate 3-phosphatidyltransferase